jgi:hypothetical protein
MLLGVGGLVGLGHWGGVVLVGVGLWQVREARQTQVMRRHWGALQARLADLQRQAGGEG